MAGSRLVKCDFFKLASEKYPKFSLLQTMDSILDKRPAVSDRNYLRDGDILRLQAWDRKQTCYHGLFIRLRRSADAKFAAVDTDILDYIALPANHSLCESMCFLYFPDTDTLVSERNRFAGSAFIFAEYIEEMSGITPIDCRFHLNKDAWKKLQKMDYVKKVDLKLEIDRKAKSYEGSSLALGDILRIKRSPGIREIAVTISAGRGKEGLWHGVKDFVTGVAGLEQHVLVKTLSVKGSDEDTSSYMIDLIADKMNGAETVAYTEKHLPLERVWRALYDAYDKVKPEIHNQAD